MKIALLTTPHPSARGGAEVLYDGLEAALGREGHDATRIEIPMDESSFEGILDGYERARTMDLLRFDAVISTKAPTFQVRHPRHILYLVHTIRVFYDMFDSWTDGSARCFQQRDRIRELDFQALSQIPEERRFAIGHEVRARLWESLGLTASVVHPALPDAESFHEGPFEHFLLAGRLHAWKRPDLVLDAFLSLPHDLPLLVTGAGEEEDRLRAKAAGDRRVRFLGDVPRSHLHDLFARALAVPFFPMREDFGYVTLEAMLAGKPVLTGSDSGEAARLVEHGKTGLIVPPTIEAVAEAMSRIVADPDRAQAMGAEGRKRAEAVTWPRVLRELLRYSEAETPTRASPRSSSDRMRLLICDNQPIDPPVGGGRIRLLGLYSHLPGDIDPVYVGTYDWRGPAYRNIIHNGKLREVTVPQSEAHFQAHEALHAIDGRLSIDVTFSTLSPLSSGFTERVAYEASRADAVVFSHPWVLPTVLRSGDLPQIPFFYDAQNVEGKLKRSLLGSEGLAGEFASLVEKLEREICGRAAGIFVCSEDDARDFERLYGVDRERIHIVPNGVDTRAIRPASGPQRRDARQMLGVSEGEPVALFIGSYYPPNADAAKFICRTLARNLPHVRFLILGGCSGDLTAEPIPANVNVLGIVDESVRNAAYAAADIAINPMSRGSGTNIKMMDFLSAGLPSVSTRIGARGVAGEEEGAFVLAELPDFSDVAARLLEDRSMRLAMSFAARRIAESRYDWREISSTVARVVGSVCSGAGIGRSLVRSGPTRLAILSTWDTRCGIAEYTGFLTRALPQAVDWRIFAETSSCGASEEPRVSRNWNIGLQDLSAIDDTLSSDPPDVLLIQHNPAFFREEALCRLLELCRQRGVRTAVTFHAVSRLNLDPDVACGIAGADRVFVHRRSDAELLRTWGIESPVRFVPQGITRLPHRDEKEVKARLGLTGAFIIGHFGYLRPHKGTIELIEAFDLIAAHNPRAHLMLLCSTYPSPDAETYSAVCTARLERSPYRERIHANFTHLPLEQVGFLLQACDVIAYPYYPSTESSSAAVRMGISAGRPILVSSSGIFEELEGIAVEAPDIAAIPLSSTILSLSRDPGLVAESHSRLMEFRASREWPRVSAQLWGFLQSINERSRGTLGSIKCS
jgi:glycosyltransferase involved in cell wall biosynthesis